MKEKIKPLNDWIFFFISSLKSMTMTAYILIKMVTPIRDVTLIRSETTSDIVSVYTNPLVAALGKKKHEESMYYKYNNTEMSIDFIILEREIHTTCCVCNVDIPHGEMLCEDERCRGTKEVYYKRTAEKEIGITLKES